MKIKISIFFVLLLSKHCYAQDDGPDWSKLNVPSWDSTWDELKQVGNGALDILSGFAQGFGICPKDRTYRMRVWNDVPAPIMAVVQNITQFLGAELAGKPIVTAKMNPFTNTGNGLANLGGVCQGAAYLTPYTGALGEIEASYDNLIYDGKTKGLEIGGAGGTTLYYTTDVLSVLTEVVGLFSGEDLLIDTVLSDFAFFDRKFRTSEDDTSTYHYRSYNNKGENHGELLGGDLTESNEFSGVFFNSSSNDAQLTYTKDNQTYTVTLESESFNVLSSTPNIANSIRPPATDDVKPFDERRSFVFTLSDGKTIKIPISSVGVADSVEDEEKNPITIPRTYSYEIYQANGMQNIGMQGLKIGHYDQPGVKFEEARSTIIAALPADLSQRAKAVAGLAQNPPYAYALIKKLRDVNPLTCSIWYQSAEKMLAETTSDPNFDYSFTPFNPPLTLWIYYNTKDTGPVLQQLSAGAASDFNLIRPQIKEKEGYLFVFALDTTTKEQAQHFFDRLFTYVRPEKYYSQIDNPMEIPEVFGIIPDINGIIDDTQGEDASGVKGYYLLKDVFNPYGISSGPFYYSIPPAILILSQLSGSLSAYIDTTAYTDAIQINKAFMNPIISWITFFAQNKKNIEGLNIKDATSANLEQAIPELTNYLQANGTEETKKNIKPALYNLIFGPTSISKPPIIWQAGSGYFTSKPDDWPTAS